MNTSIGSLIRKAEGLDNRSLDALITDMISLRVRRSRSQTNEAGLLAKINKGLPIEQVQRLRMLNEKRQKGELDDSERAELQMLVEKTENLAVGRLKYLTLLARQRAIPVRELMNQLGIGAVNG